MAFTILIPKVWKRASPIAKKLMVVAGSLFVGSAVVAGAFDAASSHWTPTRIVHRVEKLPPRIVHVRTIKYVKVPGPVRVMTKLSPACKLYIEDVNKLYGLQAQLDDQWSSLALVLSRFQVAVSTRNPQALAQAQHQELVQENRTATAGVSSFELFRQLRREKGSCK